MRKAFYAAALAALTATGASATTFTSQALFEAELESFTLIDTSTHIGDTLADINMTLAGAQFYTPLQTTVRSDDLILNGAGFLGNVGINFTSLVNAVGVISNAIDGGRIQLFSGLNGTGNLLSETGFGGEAFDSFTGVIGSDVAQSAIFTCDFNFDL